MALKEKLRGLRRNTLLENTFMLYVLTFSNALLGFITQGYQTRVLGLDKMGILDAARYVTNFFQILIDFGFIMSATAKISQHREDKAYLNKVLTCVVIAKCCFMLLSFGILMIFIAPTLTEPGALWAYLFYLLYVCMVALLPDFMYRGLEQMRAITVRAVLVKTFATLMIFVLVKRPEDFWMVPLLSAIGNGGATLFVYWHLRTKVGVFFCRVSPREILKEFKDAAQFFVSKVARAINSNLNGILLKGMVGAVATGLYGRADTVINAARTGISPIADSLYPHMVKNRNFKLIKKAMLGIYPIILAGCALVFIFAEPLLTLWLGQEAGPQAVLPLRLLIPVAAFTFPNYVLSFPTLSPMGLVKYANMSVAFGTVVYLLGLGVCWLTFGINLITLCALTSITEGSITAFLVVVIFRNRHLLRPGAAPAGSAREEGEA